MKTNSEARLPAQTRRGTTPIGKDQATGSSLAQLAIDLPTDLRDRTTDALRLAAKAEATGDLAAAISALKESIRLLELRARLTGQLRETQQVNVVNVIDPETAIRVAETYLQRHGAPRLEDKHER